jgi:hypothetical protein
MEDLLGVQQEVIGRECCDLNLLKETMGKIGELQENGKVRYPVDVSYDMGWQKAKKTYDSISGHGLMIGNAMKNVVAIQNYSTACGVCDRHSKKLDFTQDTAVPPYATAVPPDATAVPPYATTVPPDTTTAVLPDPVPGHTPTLKRLLA